MPPPSADIDPGGPGGGGHVDMRGDHSDDRDPHRQHHSPVKGRVAIKNVFLFTIEESRIFPLFKETNKEKKTYLFLSSFAKISLQQTYSVDNITLATPGNFNFRSSSSK